MRNWRHTCALLASTGPLTLCPAAQAADQVPSAYNIDFAERMVQLDAMMFVTDRVCLLKKEPLGSAYLAAQNSLSTITKASDEYLEAKYHEFHSDSDYDKMIVSTLNRYGQGHPSFGCNNLSAQFIDLSTLRGNQEIYQKALFLLQEAPNHGHAPERGGGVKAPEPDVLNYGATEELPKVGSTTGSENTLPDFNAEAPMQAEPASRSSTLERVKAQWLVETQNYTGGAFIKDF